jgi:hypothetical protein
VRVACRPSNGKVADQIRAASENMSNFVDRVRASGVSSHQRLHLRPLTYTAADDAWITTNETGDETGFWRYDAYGNLAIGTPASDFGSQPGYLDPVSRWWSMASA